MPVSRFPRFIVLAFAAAAVAGCAGGAPENDPPAASVQTTSLALPWVDRPGVSHAPVRNAAGTATAQYFGGTVTANAKVYVVWWGDPTKINSAVTAAKGGIADFFAGVTNSSFMDWLNEYSTTVAVQAGSHKGMAGTGQLIGRGNYAGTLTLSNIPSGDVTDAQIQTTSIRVRRGHAAAARRQHALRGLFSEGRDDHAWMARRAALVSAPTTTPSSRRSATTSTISSCRTAARRSTG